MVKKWFKRHLMIKNQLESCKVNVDILEFSTTSKKKKKDGSFFFYFKLIL